MGACNGNTREVILKNQCSTALGVTSTLQYFCSKAGPAGNGYASTWCAKRGAPGEWERGSRTDNGCEYDTCNPHRERKCCDGSGCCSIVGQGTTCRRIGFKGDPLKCCLQDYKCAELKQGDDAAFPLCFSDSKQKQTCAPENRSMITDSCRNVLIPYCSGSDLPPGDTSWIGRWVDEKGAPIPGGCYTIMQRNLHSLSTSQDPGVVCSTGPGPAAPGTCDPVNTDLYPVDADGSVFAQNLTQAVFTRYTGDGFTVGSLPGTSGYNPFQDFLYSNICCRYPSVCQNGLRSACSVQTAQRLSFQPEIARWCGCYLPDGEFQRYVDKFQVNKECTPTCNRAGNIPLVRGDGQVIKCGQNICIIDDVAISLSKTQVGGEVTFSQVCGGCQSPEDNPNVITSCSCIIENNTFAAVNSQIGGNVQVQQKCTAATCTAPNPSTFGPKTITVPCTGTGTDPFEGRQEEIDEARRKANNKLVINILILLAAAVIILVIAYFIIRPNTKPKGEEVISRRGYTAPTSYSSPGEISLGQARDLELGYNPYSSSSSLSSIGSRSISGR